MSSSPTKRSPAKATGTRQRARKERITPVSTSHPPYAFGALLTLGSLTILLPVVSLATLASKLALHPLYGSTTTSLHFVEVLAGTCALATTRPDLPVHTTLLLLGTLLSAAPFTARWLGSWTARWHDPIWGPVVTQMGIAVPVVGLSVVLARSKINALFPKVSPLIVHPFTSLIVFSSILFTEPVLWRYIPLGGQYTSCNIFLALGLASSVLSGLTTPLKGSTPHRATSSLLRSSLLLSVPFLIAYFSKANLPCSHPVLPALFPPQNVTLASIPSPFYTHANATGPRVNLLARADSCTGTIVVAEDVKRGFRYLRADHSLLGGVWIGEQAFGKQIGDSIYTAFVLQEAIRLAKREKADGAEENALIIGLGTGIAAQSLITHGIKTTIVEIDPAVYKYAREYFGLAAPHAVHLTDARGWVHEQSTASDPFLANLGQSPAKYDYVVHDCFSGGGVPEHLFTKEFWADLKEIIRDDGVLAVNFAGHLKSDAARAIWFTLQQSFGGCRVFHDRVETNDEKRRVAKEKKAKGEKVNDDEHDAFLNMVFFCSPVGKQLDFRPAVEEDFLDSWLRYYILGQLMDNEVTENEIVGDVPQTVVEKIRWVLTDRDNKLGVYQHQSAIEHWKLMREQVLDDEVWEVY